jgi:hypothetical protein
MVSQYWSERFDRDRTNMWIRSTVAELFFEPSRGEGD